MGANFPRVKTWVSTEDVSYSDLNAEFDNILNNLTAANVDDYSANVSQMQTTADPGEVGSESLATSVAGEIARLRKIIAEITGEDEWYESPVSSIVGLANAIGTGLTDNRLVSGKVRTSSSQPIFLDPDGAARSVYVRGTATNFIYYVNGTEYTITTDVSLTSLTAAPSSNNTCLINDAVAADQYWTKYEGEDGTEIPVDNMGTEISSLVGKFAAFKLSNGSSDEYFTAYVKSTTALSKVKRGYFFDSTDAPVPRITYANNDTITLMKLTWIFAKTDLTLTATYNNPVWSKDEPSSPSIGDYWFDLDNNTWKVYGVGSYSSANAVLIGVCIQDATNTVGARSFEFFENYTDQNTVEIFADTSSQVKSRSPGSVINVWGETIKNEHGLHTWDMTLDLDSGVTEDASTFYYFYLTQDGEVKISNIKPYDRREELGGYYHPHHSWKCVGRAFNNASSNLEQIESYYTSLNLTSMRSVISTDSARSIDKYNRLSGNSFTVYLPPAATMYKKSFRFVHAGTSLTQLYTLDGFDSETIGGNTTYVMHTNGEVLDITSNGTSWDVTSHYASTDWTNAGVITVTATSVNPTKGTVTLDDSYWRRSGNIIEVQYRYSQGAASAGAGTGDYLFALPGSLTFNATVTRYSTGAGAAAFGAWDICGDGSVSIVSGAGASVQCIPYNSTTFRVYEDQYGAASSGFVSATFFKFTDANLGYYFRVRAAITDWRP